MTKGAAKDGAAVADLVVGFKRISADKIRKNPKNWRRHPEAQREAFRGMLDSVGFAGACLVRELPRGKYELIDGELRLDEAGGDLEKGVPCLIVDVTEEQADKLLATYDPISSLATFDEDALESLLGTVDLSDVQPVDVYLNDLLGSEEEEEEPKFADPEAAAPPKNPKTKLGDLWTLGDHRLVCGDCTDESVVNRLMDGKRAAFCLTDPPYSVNYDKSHLSPERGGNKQVHESYEESDTNPVDILGFMALVPADVMVWSYPIDRHFHALADAYKKHGWEFKKELVWVKETFSFWMSAKYQQRHEPIMLCVRKGKPIGGNVPANMTTVFEYAKPRAHELHPTAKPVELWADFVKNHAADGEIVYEPFCGSGTTIIAAEQLGRVCYACELYPAYCDVIVARWEELTGKKATRARRPASKSRKK